MWVTSSTDKVLTPNAIALGNFDGIHRGHQQVLQPVLQANARIGCGVTTMEKMATHPHIYATVVSFNPHPREFFSGQKRQLLTPLEEKIAYLESLGVEQLILLPFDRELAALSAEEFVAQLVEKLQVKLISVGEDFRFGHQRQGDVEQLKAIAENYQVEVNITSLENCQTQTRISSSLVRQALEEGKVQEAKQMLGRDYTLTGIVIEGNKLGRQLGFPTANLAIPAAKFLPKQGVYLVKVTISQLNYQGFGLMNLGCRPTVGGGSTTVEVHLLNWTRDLYGQALTLSLETFLRPEQKFPSLEALKTQISQDLETAKNLIQLHSL